MKLVRQHGEGCAIASVAMLAGVDYDTAVQTFYPEWDGNYYSFDPVSNARVLKVMRHGFGLKIRQTRVTPWMRNLRNCFRMPQNPALFTCDFNEYRDTVHCAVWDPVTKSFFDPAGYIGDPIEGYVRYTTDYIEVLGRNMYYGRKENCSSWRWSF